MGEVYRARDTRLDRDVALKILPDAFANDGDRLARFEREAKTLASLNHPHVAQVYGFETSDGVSALVMELVDGEDLSQRIARGAMPIDEAIPIGRQIAEALEAAHEIGIVHRDLKPANIKVRADGAVKVLDFGLARSSATGAASAALQDSPTITSPANLTLHGVILGTAAYMSPEQARGKPVDKRSDIWSFGCVLYEMLTGRRAFGGASVTDTLSAITRDEPDWTVLPQDTRPEIRTLLQRCLRKNASERLRDVGEARIVLSEPSGASAPVRARRTWSTLTISGALIVAVIAGFAIGRGGEGRPTAVVTAFTQLTDQPGFERQPTISPDGRSVVYVGDARGNADLYLLRVGGRNAVLLTSDSDADDYAPAFSRDGNRIAFRSERAGGGIFVMEATGESVRRVSDFGFDPQWSPDGRSLVVAEEAIVDPLSRTSISALWVIDIASGRRRRVAGGDAVGGKWSPDGTRLAYWGTRRDTGNRDLFTVASDGSQAESPVSVTNDAWVDWSPAWSPDGRYVYFASNRGGTMNLWRTPIDETTGRATAAPEPLTTPTAWSGWFDLSADGTHVVFADFDERATVWATAFDPVRATLVGSPRPVLQGRAINSIDVTAAGDRIAFSQRGQPWEGLGTMWIDGTGWARLTDADVYHRLPTWSPDGQRLLFYRRSGLWTLRNDGSDLRELPVSSERPYRLYPVWSPAGDRIAAAGDDFYGVIDVSVSPARPIVVQPMSADSPGLVPFSWSADGRWLAGANLRTMSRDRVYVVDSQLKGSLRPVTKAGKSPAWLPDSRRLIYSSPTGIVVLDVESGQERELLPLPRAELPWGRLLSLSRDGRTLVYLQSHDEGDLWLMTIAAK